MKEDIAPSWLGHPRGLKILVLSSMWDRFGFYGMRCLLVLYLITSGQEGGLGWSIPEAISLYGTFSAAIWIAPLIGGVITDRWLGQKLSIILGASFMACGYLLLLSRELLCFYTALTLIAIGAALYRPSISSQVGTIYEETDPRAEGGYRLYYGGVNVGALLAAVVCGFIGIQFGYQYSFLLAAFTAIVNVTIYLGGFRLIEIVRKNFKGQIEDLTRKARERKIIKVTLYLTLLIIFFTIGYEQEGGFINVFAQRYTDRTVGNFIVPATWFMALNPLFVVLLAPLINWGWLFLEKKEHKVAIPGKVALGFFLAVIAFVLMYFATETLDFEVFGALDEVVVIKASMLWLLVFYFLETVAEMCTFPVVWAEISRIAPKRLATTLMAVPLAGAGIGSKIAGWVGSYVGLWGPQRLCVVLAVAMLLFGVFTLGIKRVLRVDEEESSLSLPSNGEKS